MYKQKIVLTLGLLLSASFVYPQQAANDTLPITVLAKKWSKVNGKSVYSDWTECKTYTVDRLPNYKPVSSLLPTRYGSNILIKSDAKGFFYTKKINDRWWIIDPEGFGNLMVVVCGVRQGPSERNKDELQKKYGSVENWINSTHTDLINLSFNGTGCWSEVPSIQLTNQNSDNPLTYNMIWNFFSSYRKQKKDLLNNVSFPVFDKDFETFVDQKAQELEKTSKDPNLLGHFSDNELEFKTTILDEYLSIADENNPNLQAAKLFLQKLGIDKSQITDSTRGLFLEIPARRYYQIVSAAIKKYDPNHLYFGSRLHGRPKNNEGIFRAAGEYADIISVNFYGGWAPSEKFFANWRKWADKPVIITEFYTKGMDSGMENKSGAGWIVKTQEDRGLHYENFCINLLKQKNCVGWSWFRYMDNDPTDTSADASNSDSNKGIVNNAYNQYLQLTKHMQIVNQNRYQLIEYFDK
jgi:hypothetical protein